MKNEQAKKATIQVHEIMIAYADKGPSGFWTDGYGRCGNRRFSRNLKKA